ncbi:hypothetical protein Smar_0867 [Staphylothermus marinus F1]|uniref:Uncharacterized protein n=1 Tax=Staphylothermus marinus (strain ATCC 43588 / DSM 3639 / JCM 9404 / F1) TaxID=399550 RepID=A3DMV7_STAMF|nr:hypothetical protein Smar_0867 [Staphylothermus marinus F1]
MGDILAEKYTVTVTIDLRLLAMRLRESGRRFIRVHEIAYELGISPKTAGKIMVNLARLGYAVKWSEGVYMLLNERNNKYKIIDRIAGKVNETTY